MSDFSYFKGFPKLPNRDKGDLPNLPIRWRLSTDAFGVDAEDIPQQQAEKLLEQAGLKHMLVLVLLQVGGRQSGSIKIDDDKTRTTKFLHYGPKERKCSSV
jgi:hypothetical protein